MKSRTFYLLELSGSVQVCIEIALSVLYIPRLTEVMFKILRSDGNDTLSRNAGNELPIYAA